MGSNCGKPDQQQRRGQEAASAGEGGGRVSEGCVCGELLLAFYAISNAMVLNV